jgi:uncharacterized membrane protein YoaT (DUF817 family)
MTQSSTVSTPSRLRVEAAERWRRSIREFLLFGLKQAWASLFGAVMLALILISHFVWRTEWPIARYDALTVAAVTIQFALLGLKLEEPREAAVILIFHLAGTAMEVFKTAHGSWIYPEASILRIGGVPLFSGFMYAAIGSYIARIWRLFDVRFEAYPPGWAAWALAIGAYVNFFTHHFVPDMRAGLFAAGAVAFGPTVFWFKPDRDWRRMPMVLGLMLVASFIWLAENLGTFASAWVYPMQRHGWNLVPISKLGAWMLLMMLSFVLVTAVRRPQPPPTCGWRRPGSGPAGPGRS